MPTPDQHADALGQVLELALLLNGDMDRHLGAIGLTPARTHLLWELQQRGPCTQKALADALEVTPRNVTGLVDALEETGFVTRAPHPTDRRATLVTFTDRGAEVAQGLVAGQRQLAATLFGQMGEATFRGLVAGLEETLDRLREAIDHDQGGTP